MDRPIPLAPDRATVDRFEGDYVVLEVEGRTIDLPRWLIPAAAREGDVLSLEIEEGVDCRRAIWRIDAESGRRAREAVAARLDRLRGGDLGGAEID